MRGGCNRGSLPDAGTFESQRSSHPSDSGRGPGANRRDPALPVPGPARPRDARPLGEAGAGSDPPDGSFEFVPSAYVDGHRAARTVDRRIADRYVRHTIVGDAAADDVVSDLAENWEPADVHAIIAQALEHPGNVPDTCPQSLRTLVGELAEVPRWFDHELAGKATSGFVRNADTVLGALVGAAIIEGFSTLISKSFRIRSRITENGVRRLKQNLAQLLDQFMPGGILPGGDGWRLSIRIRLVHAQARRLLRASPEWDESRYGLPLSAAHMLLGAAAFSGRLMQHVENLGGDFSAEEREGYVHVWKYTASLLGVPEQIVFQDYASSVRAFEVGRLCEPPPDDDAIIMANSIINCAPIVLGITEAEARRSMASYIYQVSRELIGHDLSDQLKFPAPRLIGQLPFLRLRNFGDRRLRRVAPNRGAARSKAKFLELLDLTDLGPDGFSYSLPTVVFDEESREW